jgi:hypothetical protein
MQNTGTWNSDLAIIFFFCLMAPIAFHFIVALFPDAISDPSQDEQKDVNTSPPIQMPTSVNISVSIPNLLEGLNPTEKPRRTTKPKKKKSPVPATPKPHTDKAVVLDAVSGLCNLGYKKGEATKIVKSISDKKKYDSVESLVKDCFMCIS